MSRRSLFLIAATVVVLYFSLILFMLTPLHGAKSAYFTNNYVNHMTLKYVPPVNWCKELHWKPLQNTEVVALVSFPGSGNTWLRYLLQQATGIVTGSIYMDYGLKNHGFPAENVTDGSVLVVKTHEDPPVERNKFSSAILLIRNPRDAILADFNRLHKGHIGTAPKAAFKRKTKYSNRTDWAEYVSKQLHVWDSLYRLWLLQFRGPLHVVSYEVLVRDTEQTLRSILAFLNQTVSQEELECALFNKEGIYRRKYKIEDFDPFTEHMYNEINIVNSNILNLVQTYSKL